MITINGKNIEHKTFPDGTPNLLEMPVPDMEQDHIDITWCFDDMEELSTLYMIASYYRDVYPKMERRLIMPYVPNARMDRTKDTSECFTLKYMCQMLNSLEFACVEIFDPHSDVTPALLDHVHVISAKDTIMKAIEMDEPDVLCFPDAGAQKRYEGFKPERLGIVSATKHRDWKTGKLTSCSLSRDVSCLNVLIIDDICSYGGTFKMVIDEMNKKHGLHQPSGISGVALYVSHCEKNIFDGELFKDKNAPYKSDAIRNFKLYTTDSILHPEDVPEQFKDDVIFVKRFRTCDDE